MDGEENGLQETQGENHEAQAQGDAQVEVAGAAGAEGGVGDNDAGANNAGAKGAKDKTAAKRSGKAAIDFEAAIAERDGKIAELEAQVAEAAKSAEAADALASL